MARRWQDHAGITRLRTRFGLVRFFDHRRALPLPHLRRLILGSLILLPLVVGCEFARAELINVDRMAGHFNYQVQVSAGLPTYDDGDTACAYIAGGFNSNAGIHDYLNPRYLVDPDFGEGCSFTLVERAPPGTVQNVFAQRWVLRTPACLDKYQISATGSYPTTVYSCNRSTPAPPHKQNACGIGNPVMPGSGIKTAVASDYLPANAKLFRFERFYRSSATWGPNNQVIGRFGGQWYDTYRRKLIYASNGSPDTLVTASLLRPDGRIVIFGLVQGTWSAEADTADQLIQLTDSAGTTIGWQYRLALDDSTETYNAAGVLTSITARSGEAVRLTYSDPSTASTIAFGPGLLIRVTDAVGRQLNLIYDTSGRVARLIDPAGAAYLYTYDAHNNLASVTYPDGKVRTYHYENAAFANALTGITDENGVRFATYAYDAQGRAISSEHAGGAERYTFAYGSNGSTTVIDALNTSRSYSFDIVLGVYRNSGLSQPCPSGCGGGSAAASTYDANGNLASRTDFNGNRSNYTYDLTRNLETQRVEGLSASGGPTPATRTTTTEWDSAFRLPRRVAEPLRVTSFTYDSHGNLLTKTIQPTSDSSGAAGFSAAASGTPRMWTYTNTYFDPIPGLLIRQVVDGPRTDVQDLTTYSWNESGNLVSITNALGHSVRLDNYDVHGRPQTVIDPNGLVTALTYDVRGRLASRNVGGEITDYQYDALGQLIQMTLPDASFASYTYDAPHRLIAVRDSAGNQIAYTLDAIGNRIKEEVSDPSGALVQKRAREYDALSRLSREIGAVNPAAEITQYNYDNQGNLISVADPLGHVTTSGYDALNRVVRVIDPAASGAGLGGTTQYAYDGLDQLTQVSDARGLITRYSVDGLGNRSVLQSPDTGVTASTYDAAGNLVSETDARGMPASFTYDALNRVRQANYAGVNPVLINYTYDQTPNGVGRLTGISDVSGSTTLSYDLQGRLTQDARAIAGVNYVTRYDYDQAGRLIRLTYPSGRTVDYGLDALGRVASIQTTYQGLTQAALAAVAYQPFGPAKSLVFGNAQGALRSFDLDARMSSYSLAGSTRSLAYDNASRLIAFGHANAGLNQSFDYDNLSRLTHWSTPNTSQSFGYDVLGNRVEQTLGATTLVYSYAALSNQLQRIDGGSLANAYQYDAAGALRASTPAQFSYDARHRLIQASWGAQSTAYQLNALGQRVMKLSTNSGAATVYHYDSGGRLIAESDVQGNVQVEYLYLGEIPVAAIQ